MSTTRAEALEALARFLNTPAARRSDDAWVACGLLSVTYGDLRALVGPKRLGAFCPSCGNDLDGVDWDGEGEFPGHHRSCPRRGNPPHTWRGR